MPFLPLAPSKFQFARALSRLLSNKYFTCFALHSHGTLESHYARSHPFSFSHMYPFYVRDLRTTAFCRCTVATSNSRYHQICYLLRDHQSSAKQMIGSCDRKFVENGNKKNRSFLYLKFLLNMSEIKSKIATEIIPLSLKHKLPYLSCIVCIFHRKLKSPKLYYNFIFWIKNILKKNILFALSLQIKMTVYINLEINLLDNFGTDFRLVSAP